MKGGEVWLDGIRHGENVSFPVSLSARCSLLDGTGIEDISPGAVRSWNADPMEAEGKGPSGYSEPFATKSVVDYEVVFPVT